MILCFTGFFPKNDRFSNGILEQNCTLAKTEYVTPVAAGLVVAITTLFGPYWGLGAIFKPCTPMSEMLLIDTGTFYRMKYVHSD